MHKYCRLGKILGIIILLLGCITGNTATTIEKTTKGPRIYAEQTSYDFGVVPQFGGTVTHEFEIENRGDEVLKIISISTSCACTTAEIDKYEIPPGGKATVKVTFDPNVHEEPKGRFHRVIFIESNDPLNEEFWLKIYVDIDEGR
jgi:hypothetical protein